MGFKKFSLYEPCETTVSNRTESIESSALTALCAKIDSVADTYSTFRYIDAQTARETLMNISKSIKEAMDEQQ